MITDKATETTHEIIHELLDSITLEEIPGFDIFKSLGYRYLSYYTNKKIPTDPTFGLRYENRDYYIGNARLIEVHHNANNDRADIVLSNDINTIYPGTEGLWELLTMQKPKNYTEEDLKNYEKIILSTESYRSENGQIKSSRGHKYLNFIQPMLIDTFTSWLWSQENLYQSD